tara:strand:- start:100 stop:621 length:522 start_codon:yes stop_codon:yes gene_type:complete
MSSGYYEISGNTVVSVTNERLIDIILDNLLNIYKIYSKFEIHLFLDTSYSRLNESLCKNYIIDICNNYKFLNNLDDTLSINDINNISGLDKSDIEYIYILNSNVTTILSNTFINCNKLLYVNINYLTEIGNSVFSNCQKLNKYYYEEKIYNNGIDLINYLLDSGITIGVNVFE